MRFSWGEKFVIGLVLFIGGGLSHQLTHGGTSLLFMGGGVLVCMIAVLELIIMRRKGGRR